MQAKHQIKSKWYDLRANHIFGFPFSILAVWGPTRKSMLGGHFTYKELYTMYYVSEQVPRNNAGCNMKT